jgi:hypothetical protein
MGEPEIDRSTAFMSNCIFSRQDLIEMLAVNSMNSFSLSQIRGMILCWYVHVITLEIWMFT